MIPAPVPSTRALLMLRKTSVTFVALLLTASGCGDRYDRILVGGDVYDGRGNPPQVADIGINADRIVAIGDLSAASAGQRTDVSGLAVVPGLVDIHDIAVLDPEAVEAPAGFGDPHRYATGVRHVLVSGVLVLEDGEVTGARPGRALRRGR